MPSSIILQETCMHFFETKVCFGCANKYFNWFFVLTIAAEGHLFNQAHGTGKLTLQLQD